MNVAIVTGSAGLVGSETVAFLQDKFDVVVGIDNDMRQYFFGKEASTEWKADELSERYSNYVHERIDIRFNALVGRVFHRYGKDIKLVVHTAAQPSHDWAANEPLTDFGVNATGTLNLLETTRLMCPDATFIFTSTNKVYGDTPNRLPLVELDTRWEIDQSHRYYAHGIDEHMSIDHTTHSVFGASKVAADVMCQEYGRYFGMQVGVFRGGCLTGPDHSGAQLHGFLAYLMKCVMTSSLYTIFGYKGKQVRDNIHVSDLVQMFWHFHQNPRPGEVYNAGGGRHSNCSMLEAIRICENITGKKAITNYTDSNRIGDHIWYISDVSKFRAHYPDWNYQYNVEDILADIHNGISKRL